MILARILALVNDGLDARDLRDDRARLEEQNRQLSIKLNATEGMRAMNEALIKVRDEQLHNLINTIDRLRAEADEQHEVQALLESKVQDLARVADTGGAVVHDAEVVDPKVHELEQQCAEYKRQAEDLAAAAAAWEAHATTARRERDAAMRLNARSDEAIERATVVLQEMADARDAALAEVQRLRSGGGGIEL